MRIAVTGGNGFLGKPTVDVLKGLGADATVVSRQRAGNSPGGVLLDIADSSTWPNLMLPHRPDRLIHLAWDYLGDFDDPRHYLELLPRHLAFLAWCVSNGITDITVAGTCYEYGLTEGRLDEGSATRPVTAYGIAKDALRRALEHLAAKTSFSLKWARIFFVRGDETEEKGVFKLIRQAALEGKKSFELSRGEQLRDYLPRKDVGRFFARFCLQNEITGAVNCCSGSPVSMRRMIEEYGRQWPQLRLEFGTIPYRSYEPLAFWGNKERMESVMMGVLGLRAVLTH